MATTRVATLGTHRVPTHTNARKHHLIAAAIAGPKVAVALLPTLLQAVHGRARARLRASKTDEAAPPLDVLRVGGEGVLELDVSDQPLAPRAEPASCEVGAVVVGVPHTWRLHPLSCNISTRYAIRDTFWFCIQEV